MKSTVVFFAASLGVGLAAACSDSSNNSSHGAGDDAGASSGGSSGAGGTGASGNAASGSTGNAVTDAGGCQNAMGCGSGQVCCASLGAGGGFGGGFGGGAGGGLGGGTCQPAPCTSLPVINIPLQYCASAMECGVAGDTCGSFPGGFLPGNICLPEGGINLAGILGGFMLDAGTLGGGMTDAGASSDAGAAPVDASGD